MKNFIITVTAHCPAPRAREYRIEAWDFGTAVSRAFKQFRKDLGRKKISEVEIHAKSFAKVETKQPKVETKHEILILQR